MAGTDDLVMKYKQRENTKVSSSGSTMVKSLLLLIKPDLLLRVSNKEIFLYILI
jgi:hypothetical protein